MGRGQQARLVVGRRGFLLPLQPAHSTAGAHPRRLLASTDPVSRQSKPPLSGGVSIPTDPDAHPLTSRISHYSIHHPHSASAAFPAPDFSLSDALATFAFLHIHTHAPQVAQSLFPARLELARVLALLPLSTSSATGAGQPSLSPSKAPRGSGASGGGPDSSVLRLLWAGSGGRQWKKQQQGPAELVLAQRTGRLSTAVGGNVVYHLATAVRNPEQIPALAGGLAGDGDGVKGAKMPGQQQQQEGALVFALLVAHSAEQGCLEATLLAPQGGGLFDARRDAGTLRAACGASCVLFLVRLRWKLGLGGRRWDLLKPAHIIIHKIKTTAALSRYVTETIRAHRALSLRIPDLTLALISPFATMHRILLRMPEASQPTGPAPARLSSASVYNSNGGARAQQPNYRVISVRFLSETPGLFTVVGLAPADQALLPAWVMEKVTREKD